MDRIFQNYEGEVTDLVGLGFSAAKSLVSTLDGDIILIWLQEKESKLWFRIFIDGVYCGIDRYNRDESALDIDDDVQFEDLSDFFVNKIVKTAVVSNYNNLDMYIKLDLNFENASRFSLICKDSDGNCTMSFGRK